MKVLLLTTHLDVGGIGIYTVMLAKYLHRSGVDVTVASSGGSLTGELEWYGVPHKYVDIRTKAEFGFKMWKSLPPMTDYVKRSGFDIIHAQTRISQVLSFFLCELTGIPFVTTCHGFFKHRRLSRRLLPCWGKKAIAISKSVEEHLVNDLGVSREKVFQIYNGIELEKFSEEDRMKDDELVKKLGITVNDFVIGTIGRLSSVKGYKYLVEAFKYLSVERPEAKLLIVGRGPEEGALKLQAERLSLKDRVIFETVDGDCQKYLSVMDAFCLPSLHEGLGLSLMEAMAMGKPCIATNVGGLAELITDSEEGLLVPVESGKSISDAVIRLMDDDTLRHDLSMRAHEKAINNFSIINTVKQVINVYNTVCDAVENA